MQAQNLPLPRVLQVSKLYKSREREIRELYEREYKHLSEEQLKKFCRNCIRRRSRSYKVAKEKPKKVNNKFIGKKRQIDEMNRKMRRSKLKSNFQTPQISKLDCKPANQVAVQEAEGPCFRLESHQWFAKRFRMEDRDGFRIPKHKNGKGKLNRSLQRQVLAKCVMEDQSYWNTYIIQGPSDNIKQIIQTICPESQIDDCQDILWSLQNQLNDKNYKRCFNMQMKNLNQQLDGREDQQAFIIVPGERLLRYQDNFIKLAQDRLELLIQPQQHDNKSGIIGQNDHDGATSAWINSPSNCKPQLIEILNSIEKENFKDLE